LKGGEDGAVPSLLLLLLGAQHAADRRRLHVLLEVALNESWGQSNDRELQPRRCKNSQA
jgi:hypothetical protein